MSANMEEWENQLQLILQEFKSKVQLRPNQLFLVGCSTSEVIGQKIGTAGTMDVAAMIFRQLSKFAGETGMRLAFQCCEHLNRAIVLERRTAQELHLDEVSVIPIRTAGGAMATYAFENLNDPVVVEFIRADAGMDIGDTLIGMHLKHVAVPVRVHEKQIGNAHITLATTRPKLIGGSRAVYEKKINNDSCR